jgi:hydrogenase expression/formation protein HypC
MCLGVPGKIVELYEQNGLHMGKVDFGGVFREACLDYLPQAEVGNYVVIHVGFAISLLSEREAAETLAALREVSDINAELGLQPGEKSL